MDWLSSETMAFLAALRVNNDRQWFALNKPDYEARLKRPGERFAAALADEMAARTGANHEYRIFRIHRDVRFAKDKTPYHAHLHISLSPAGGCRDGGPAWMVGLDPDGLTLGAGIFAFSPAQLDRWRALCASAEETAIAALLVKVQNGGARISNPELKRVPAPFAPDHPAASLLRRKGLTAWLDPPAPDIAFGPKGPAHCADRLLTLEPLFERLASLAKR